MQKQKGSITIFSLLSLLLVMTTVFRLLECTRYQEIKRLAGLQTQTALESVFAEYSSFLWKNYQLLGCHQTQLEATVKDYGNARYAPLTKRNNFLLFQVKDTELLEYTLLTDGEGKAFMHEVSDYMKKHILYETAKKIWNQYEVVRKIKEDSSMDLSDIDTALKELEEANTQENKAEKPNSIGSAKKKDDSDTNILEVIKKIQKNGILELVLEDTGQLSEQQISLGQAVSGRKLDHGNQMVEDTDWMDKIWLQQYFLLFFSNFCEQKEDHSLSYEIEYLIGGKETDMKNLKIVVTELLAIREAANFVYLLSDVKKVEQAGAMALALAGVSANPILIEVIKTAILTAWAFGESILDVRALLQNKRVPFLKNESLWTLQLENIGKLTTEYMTAKESDIGLSYEEYLGILLLFQKDQRSAMRGMDIQEAALKKQYNEEIKMDQMLIRAKMKITYTYAPLFSSMDVSSRGYRWKYEVVTVENFGYY